MKEFFTGWRQYLLVERYSIKDGLEALKPNNKKMRNLYKRYVNQTWHRDVENDYIDPREDPEPPVPEEKIVKAAADYRSYIFEIIPEDIAGPNAVTPEQKKNEADKNQGLTIMWIRKLSLENPKIARDVINGEIAYTGSGTYGEYSGIMPDLEIYFQNLDLMPKRNLIELESFEELHQMVEAAKEEIYARQQDKQYMDAGEGTEVLKDDGEWFIAAIHNKGAACELGKGTDWCTAAPGLDYFSDYYEPDDPLFIFQRVPNTDKNRPLFLQQGHKTHPGGEEKYQFHYGSEQFMDKNDSHVDDELFQELHGLLMQTEAPKKYSVVQNHHYEILAEDRATPPEELAALAENPNVNEGILTKVANNPSTPLETLEKLAKYDNKFIRRAVQVNAALDMGLAIELFVSNPKDDLMYARGIRDIYDFVTDGKLADEQANQIIDSITTKRGYNEPLRGHKPQVAPTEVANLGRIYEHKIKIRIKRC